MKRIYLDYAAGTPLDPRVLKFMRPYLTSEFGNPGSLHSFGQAAMAAVDEARGKIARALGADFREIIFTGSATEANNLALRGALLAAKRTIKKPRLIVSAVEHESILETARVLEKDGVDVVYLPVNKEGVTPLPALRKALTPETVLVSIMYVNNETGAIQPVKKIGKIIREFRGKNNYPLFHTDAAQAFYLLDCRPAWLKADLITLSAQKVCGPKGVGALYVGNRVSGMGYSNKTPLTIPHTLDPILTGGGQEYGLRSATENVPAIAGFGKAVELAQEEIIYNSMHIIRMRDMFLSGLVSILPKMRINNPKDNALHIINIWLPGHKAEDVLTRLDLLGVAISSGSACRARAAEPSPVLRAMGQPEKRVRESIRVSFGRPTTGAEVKAALKAFRSILQS